MAEKRNRRKTTTLSYRTSGGGHRFSRHKKKQRETYDYDTPGEESLSDTPEQDEGAADRDIRQEKEDEHRPQPYYQKKKTINRRNTGSKSKVSYRSSRKKRSGCLIPVIALVILVVAAFAGVNVFLRSTFSKVDKYQLNSDELVLVENDENADDYQIIALFGVDDQDNTIKDYGSRSDSIILACIHKKTKEVKLLSIYRDTYVSINGEYDKINAAYSYGGPELALSTINRNLDLNISDFVTINFKALADAVDVVGGIELTVESETELNNLNDYIGNMNKINGGDSSTFEASDFPFTATFDGNQAVAYSRIRYMEGGDHARASHQRLVLNGIADKIKTHPWKIMTLANKVLPQCKTSLSSGDMTGMCLSLMQYDIVDSQAYPFEDHSVDFKYNGVYYGFPLTAESNAIMAHEYLFDTTDYQVSDELSQISQKIQWVTEDYGY